MLDVFVYHCKASFLSLPTALYTIFDITLPAAGKASVGRMRPKKVSLGTPELGLH